MNEGRMIENPTALEEIEVIRQQIAAMGANDGEFARLNEIERDYREGKFTESEAKKLANAVQSRKQSDH